jgi:hypothetical protein
MKSDALKKNRLSIGISKAIEKNQKEIEKLSMQLSYIREEEATNDLIRLAQKTGYLLWETQGVACRVIRVKRGVAELVMVNIYTGDSSISRCTVPAGTVLKGSKAMAESAYKAYYDIAMTRINAETEVY